jgi:hypothetical protein
MTEKRIVGVHMSPGLNPDYSLMKAAGIGWVRVSFSFPFKDRLNGEYSDDFLKELANARRLSQLGFRMMGTTPLAGLTGWNEKDQQTAWRSLIPAWAGAPADDSFYETYERACAVIARLTAGMVELWQIGNEMDADGFRGPLTPEQAARFMLVGGRGVIAGNPAARAGFNPASLYNSEWSVLSGEWYFRRLYAEKDHPFAYAGIDGYFGSWAEGGPQDWIPRIEEIYRLTGKPVLINEWGYSSLGGLPKPPGRKGVRGSPVCDAQGWHYVWDKEHSPAEQAAYARIGLKIFATYPHVLGGFWYDWQDDPICGHCGRANCPAECGWGLVDGAGQPKPAYHAFKETVEQHY